MRGLDVIRPLIASSDAGDESPAVFVEAALVRLLQVLGVPVPEDLEEWA